MACFKEVLLWQWYFGKRKKSFLPGYQSLELSNLSSCNYICIGTAARNGCLHKFHEYLSRQGLQDQSWQIPSSNWYHFWALDVIIHNYWCAWELDYQDAFYMALPLNIFQKFQLIPRTTATDNWCNWWEHFLLTSK